MSDRNVSSDIKYKTDSFPVSCFWFILVSQHGFKKDQTEKMKWMKNLSNKRIGFYGIFGIGFYENCWKCLLVKSLDSLCVPQD